MKFKKVEISAFRIYDKPDAATFDFTIESGEPANFISLYAPNGFGKTSFYDAIEWGITNNVQRFWQNETTIDNTNQSINVLRDIYKKQINLLRNTNSLNKTKTFVKIITDEKEFPTRVLYVHGKSKTDTSNEVVSENTAFRKVILSQEWISAFLKEVKGEKRFEIFMENPDLIELNTYYNGVKTLVSINESNIQSLKDQLDKEKLKIVKLEDENLLETINSCINLLKENGEQIEIITLSTNSKDALDLSNTISSKLVIIDSEFKKYNLLNNMLTVAKTGNQEIIGLDLYSEQIVNLQTIEKELLLINSLINKFENQTELLNEINSIKAQKSELISKKEVLNKYALLYGEFEKHKNSLIQLEERKMTDNENIDKLIIPLNELKIQESELKIKRDSNYLQLSRIKDKLSNSGSLKLNLEAANAIISNSDQAIKILELEIEEKEIIKQKIGSKIEEYYKTIEEIEKNEYPLRLDQELINYDTLIKEQEHRKIDYYKLKVNLDNVTTKIEKQQSLNTVIEDFIKKGLEIVNESQDSNCPLCNQQYQSYNELAEKISSNKLLSNLLQETLKERTEIQDSIAKIKNEIERGNEILIEVYNSSISKLNKDLLILNEAINSITKQINEINFTKENSKVKLSEFNNDLDGLNIEDYERKLNINLIELVTNNDTYSLSIEQVTKQINSLNEQIVILSKQKNFTEKELDLVLNNQVYRDFTNWFEENYPNQIIDLKLILNSNDILVSKIDEFSTRIREIELTVDDFIKELKNYTKDGLITCRTESNLKREQVIQSITSYQYFLENKLSIQNRNLNKEEIKKLIDEKEAEIKKELFRLSLLNNEYLKLSKFNANLLPYLQSENAKIEIKKMEEDLLFLQGEMSDLLKKEKDNVKSYLELKVQEFFYTDLINQIYNKIDPHPDFKGVEFRVDFDVENPRLDVLVKNSNNEEKLIPNLYFSTAQINILSLSIFLASALNSKEYNCIFIDDPIQSLDSINVLSTIDLLRSIVVNEDKQIILSTHDENFHNLLKKKMPVELFKSKFMELESFGKVKQEAL